MRYRCITRRLLAGWLTMLAALALLLAPVTSVYALGTARSGSGETTTPAASAGPLGQPTTEQQARIETALGQMPLMFVENQGQADARVAYYLKGGDTTIFFGSDGLTLAIDDVDLGAPVLGVPTQDIGRYSVKLSFVGARSVRPVGEQPLDGTVSYFGGRPEDWQTGVATFGRIRYAELWPGIDLVFYGSDGGLKYEFAVDAGADAGLIALAYSGVTALSLDESGVLNVLTPVRTITDTAPLAYQDVGGQRQNVGVAFALASDGRGYGFALGSYDTGAQLVIDPELVYCGYIGGSASDSGYDIAVDGSGYAYIVGATMSSTELPTTVGPDLTHGGGTDAFIAKVKADGSGFVYLGYIGGSGNDSGTGVAVDADGAAYVAGSTSSSESTGFPVLTGPDLTFNDTSSTDAFVAKVAANGASLVFCGYLGGASQDSAADIDVDSSGAAYVVGTTKSGEATFPVSGGPDLTFNSPSGVGDGFVAKVEADGTALVYCGYVGGSGNDAVNDVTVDSSGQAYMAGATDSSEATFPVTVGPDLTINGTSTDAFVAKVAANGLSFVYCGYIGGSATDTAAGIAVDDDGYAYVAGQTASSESTFPVAGGPDLTMNGTATDAFVAKVESDGTGLVYCGYVGGTANDNGTAIAVDGRGAAYVVGSTQSSEATFPVTVGPDLTYNDTTKSDAFVAKVASDGLSLEYCGYIGGSDSDFANSVAVDSTRAAYIAGSTSSDTGTFPLSVGPDLTYAVSEAFVAKVSGPPTYSISGTVLTTGGSGLAGVQVNAGTAGSATTAADGTYSISGLDAGTYPLTASKAGYLLSSRSNVTLPPGATAQDFTAEAIAYGVSLAPVTRSLSGPQGGAVQHTFTLTNTGNVSDSFTAAVTGATWTTTPLTFAVGPLAPGATSSITVTVSVPGGATGGSTSVATLGAVSTTSAAATASATLTTTAEDSAEADVDPSSQSTLSYAGTGGHSTSVTVPIGAAPGAVTLVYTPTTSVSSVPPRYAFTGCAFTLEAQQSGSALPTFTFSTPVTVTIVYVSGDVTDLDEDSLVLNYWDGSAWVDAASTCAPASTYTREPASNRISVGMCRVGDFAVFGEPAETRLYVPLMLKQQ